MSMSDCEKCWETPCACGFGYLSWSPERLREQIALLTGVLDESNPRLAEWRAELKQRAEAQANSFASYFHDTKPMTVAISREDLMRPPEESPA